MPPVRRTPRRRASRASRPATRRVTSKAFATLYAEIAQAIRAARPGGPQADKAAHFPTLIDGLKGVEFIEAVVRSSARGGRWIRLPH